MESPTDAMQQDSSSLKLNAKENNSNNNSVNMDKEENGTVNSQNAENTELERQDSYCDLTLDTLPSEIFLHICSFLDARFVIHTLSKVCRSFHYLIMDDKFWKVRIAKRWPRKYPAIPGQHISMVKLCRAYSQRVVVLVFKIK